MGRICSRGDHRADCSILTLSAGDSLSRSDRSSSSCRSSAGRVPRRVQAPARHPADPGHHRRRAVLRRGRRHAARHPLPFGSRVNRAWGLALRKRFCRQFNFELQAAATEDALLLSLGPQHSFPLDTRLQVPAPRYGGRDPGPGPARRAHVRHPLALERDDRAGDRRGAAAAGRRRRRSSGCSRRISWPPRSPTPPRAWRTFRATGRSPIIRWSGRRSTTACTRSWTSICSSPCSGGSMRARSSYVARDLPEPSPLAHEILNARPYAFLDDAPAEERRTQAVYTRRAFEPSSADDLGALDPAAIERVRDEAWPDVRDADELHDALLTSGFLTEVEGSRAGGLVERLLARAGEAGRAGAGQLAMARLSGWPPSGWPRWQRGAAVRRASAAKTPFGSCFGEGLGSSGRPRPPSLPPRSTSPESDADIALAALEGEGVVLRGRFTPDGGPRRSSGATAGCSPGSTATRSTGSGPRSSRSARRTSCGSCSLAAGRSGAASGRARRAGHRHRPAGWIRASRRRVGERRARGPGRRSTTRRCWTRCA